MKINLNEFSLGVFFGLMFYPVIGMNAVLMAPITGLLWALGGSENKAFRRFGIPLTTAIFTGLFIGSLLAIPVFMIGYGVRDVNEAVGSTLGEFWFKITRNIDMTNILTRGTIYITLFLVYYLDFKF